MCSTPSANRGSTEKPPTLVNGTTECHTYGETAIIIIVLSEFLHRQNFFSSGEKLFTFCPLLSCTVGEIFYSACPYGQVQVISPTLQCCTHTKNIESWPWEWTWGQGSMHVQLMHASKHACLHAWLIAKL